MKSYVLIFDKDKDKIMYLFLTYFILFLKLFEDNLNLSFNTSKICNTSVLCSNNFKLQNIIHICC